VTDDIAVSTCHARDILCVGATFVRGSGQQIVSNVTPYWQPNTSCPDCVPWCFSSLGDV
jgi:hypothetical protein